MAQRSVADLVRDFLAERRLELITPADLRILRSFVSNRTDRRVTDERLLELLDKENVEIHRSLGGMPVELRELVHTRSRDSAAESLREMSSLYADAVKAGDKQRAADCRRAVIAGKERIKKSLRNPRISIAKRAEKDELLEWFLRWLESPAIFPDWLELRLRSSRSNTLTD